MYPFRFLFRVPGRAIRLVLWLLLLVVIVFFAATRTRVGRGVVKHQIEREFAERFGGHLSIGEISGNLVYRVVANRVELFDDRGARVGSIDSIVVRPRWRRLAQGYLEFGRLFLYGPTLNLVRDTSGTWNISRAITPRVFSDTSTAETSVKSIAVGDLRILSGEVSTVSRTRKPDVVADGLLFDYTNSNVGVRDAHMTIDWTPALAHVDIIRMSASVGDGAVEATRLEGQLVVEDGRYFVNQLLLETPTSRLVAKGAYDRRGRTEDAFVDVSLEASPVDNEELGRLIPALPVRGRMELSARARGPLSALVVEDITARHGGSRVSASGTLVGLPDSLDFEVSITDGRLRRSSVRTLLPDVNVRGWTNADSLVVSVFGRGVVQRPFAASRSGSGDFFIDISGDVGQLSGRVSFSRADQGALTLTSDLVANEFDVARAFRAVDVPVTLSGDISIDGGGRGRDDLVASIELDLLGSKYRDQRIDSIKALSSYSPSAITAEVQIASGSGSAVLDIAANLLETPARYSVDMTATNLDIGPFLDADSLSTALNGELSTRYTMTTIDDLEGTLEVALDSTLIRAGQGSTTVPPAAFAIALEKTDDADRRLSVRGDVAEVDARVRGAPTTGVRLVSVWMSAFEQQLRHSPDSMSVLNAPYADATEIHTDHDSNSFDATMAFRRVDTEFLSGFFPRRAPVAGLIDGEINVTISDRRLTADASVTGDSLLLGPLRARQYSARANVGVDRGDVLSSMDADVQAVSEWYSFGGSGMPDLRLGGHISSGSGALAIESGEGSRLGPLSMKSTLALSGTDLTLTPSHLLMEARGNSWSLVESGPVSISPSSIRTGRLILSSRSAPGAEPQLIELRGGLSSDPDERLFARFEMLNLAEVSNLLSLKANVGGTLSGTATLFKRQSTPVLESALNIRSLRLDTRVLGDVEVSSQLQPGTSTVLLDVVVSPALDTLASAVRNLARVTGNVRLPAFGQSLADESGRFDLQASIERADLFFFEYIFPGTVTDVSGAVAGEAKITGTPSRPVFDADFAITDGRFAVPEFNLDMALNGDVFVDQFGVHIRRADVTDKTGGTAVVSGDVLFNDYRFFSLNLYGQLADFQIMDVSSSRTLPFYGHIWGSGTASLSGPISAAELRASTVRTSPRSELFIPLVESEIGSDGGFIIFADSSGQIPNLATLTRRQNVLASRPQGERGFTEGMDIEINIDAPEGSTVHLVIDPLLGDVINAVGSGRVQILRKQGEFETFGTFQVDSGDYLFTAGEVFVRRFLIEDGGLITWDGDPTNALLDIPAAFRTRASRAGLGPSSDGSSPLIPVVVNLRITGRVSAPEVALALAIDRSAQDLTSSSDREFLETILNDPQQSTEYATSVLLTNSFALTTTTSSGGEALGTGAFNSLSQLIATQLNRYLSSALPNVDFSFGVQGESGQELDITYGVALRLLDERLVIRGEGVYQGTESAANESLQGEFVVEVKLSRHVSVEIFYRREGDALAAERILTSTTGAGISYRTEFPTWRRFFSRLFGWMFRDKPAATEPDGPVVATAPSEPVR